jgi:hypothetical protein
VNLFFASTGMPFQSAGSLPRFSFFIKCMGNAGFGELMYARIKARIKSILIKMMQHMFVSFS